MSIKPIRTHYNGYYFRSRLEARWAVFFDSLRIPYQYELEGFDLGVAWYLPDFYLTEWDIWIEIKPILPMDDVIEVEGQDGVVIHKVESGPTEVAKLFMLQEEWNKFKHNNMKHYIFFGTPGIPRIEVQGENWRILDGSVGLAPYIVNGNLLLDVNAFATDCDGEVRIWPYYMDKKFLPATAIDYWKNSAQLYANPVFPKGFIPRLYLGNGIYYSASGLNEAYSAAREADFKK